MDYKKVGIDLGSYSIKFSHVKEVGDLIERKFTKEYILPNMTTEKEYFTFLKKCIVDFLKIARIKFASFCFTIPCSEPNTMLRFITMPVVDKKTLQKSLKYEIEEKEMTKNIDDIYYHWEIIRSSLDESGKDYNVLLAIVKKKYIKELAKLKTTSWKIENIEFQPISIGRIVHGYSTVIDFGHRSTRVYMYRDGNLASVDTINIGGKFFSELITNKFHLKGKQEIEDIKRQAYIINEYVEEDVSEDVMTISSLITNESRQLFNELKRLIRSFELQNSTIIEDVYYLGRTANIKYFIESLARELELKVKPLELITPKNSDEELMNLEVYTLSSSAAIYKKYNYFNDLNFYKNTNFQVNLAPIIVGLACASILAHTGVYYVNDRYDSYIGELTSIQQEQEQLVNSLNNDISNVGIESSNAMMTTESINGLLRQQKWLSDILYILPDITPQKMIVSNIMISEGIIKFNGYTTNYSDIGFFAMQLEKFGSATIDSIQNEVSEQLSPETDDNDIEDTVKRGFEITLNYHSLRINDNLFDEGTIPSDTEPGDGDIVDIDPTTPIDPIEEPGNGGNEEQPIEIPGNDGDDDYPIEIPGKGGGDEELLIEIPGKGGDDMWSLEAPKGITNNRHKELKPVVNEQTIETGKKIIQIVDTLPIENPNNKLIDNNIDSIKQSNSS